MPTTIADVAARAGVSTATVSRVLNGTAVRPDLALAVRKAVQELDYSPDRAARSLRRGLSEVIALVLPDIENPFFTALARGVEDVARQHDLSLVLCNTDDDPQREEQYLRIAESHRMAGVLVAPANGRPALAPLVRAGRAVVVVDRPVAEEVDHVLFDNVGLGRRATAQLVEAGHERIACVTGPRQISTAVERATGWSQTLREAGVQPPTELLRHVNYRVDGGYQAAAEMLALDRPPEAILATNNLVGVGVLQALSALGEPEIPVSVIGDLPFLSAAPAGLTVLPLHPRQMGLRAAKMLMARLGGDTTPPRRVTLPCAEPGPQSAAVAAVIDF